MYRVGIEWLLGLRKQNDVLVIDPCIPSHWEGFSATVRHHSAVYEIIVTNPKHRSKGVAELYMDGLPSDRIMLQDDGHTHNVRVVMGEPQAQATSRQRARASG